jgi:hypothetical protein
MGTWFWINVPPMVLAFALTTGLSYALLLRSRRTTPPVSPATAVAPTVAASRIVPTRPAVA